jgi:hypothetical protein
MLRPLLGAFIEKNVDLDGLLKMTSRATSRWGGANYPIFEFDQSPEKIRKTMAVLAVDFCWTESPDATLKEFCRQDGFAWFAGGDQGPFSKSDGEFNNGLLESSWLLHTVRDGEIHLPTWDDNDPLRNLFSVLFGGVDDLSLGVRQKAEIAARLQPALVNSSTPLHELLTLGGMVALSGRELVSQDTAAGLGLVEVDPENPKDLINFWNLRAFGFDVLPIPRGYEEAYTKNILEHPELTAHLDKWRHGNDNVEFSVIHWWPSTAGADAHPAIQELATQLGATLYEGSADPDLLSRQNLRPGYTYFERTFDASADPSDWHLNVDLPVLPWKHGRPSGGYYVGRIAADIRLLSETGLRPDRIANLPYYRRLSPLIHKRSFSSDLNPVRTRGEGRVLGIQARSETIELSLIPSFALFESLAGNSDWILSQSDEGHFASRLGILLGGAASYVANQPALANVLEAAARKGSSGISIGEIRDRIKNYRGDWPGILSQETPEQYAYNQSVRLVNTKLLRPVMPLKCPACRSTLPLTPQQVNDEVHCDFCGESFALGLALSLANKNPPWSYRLASHVSREKLISTLPMLASLSLLARLEKGGTATLPHVFGLKVDDAKGRELEIDVAAYVDDHHPAVVLAEIKNHDDFTEQDISNLVYVSDQLRSVGTESLIMVGTLQEELSKEEKDLLLAYCASAKFSIEPFHQKELSYPLIFINKDLTANPWGDDHPWRWSAPGSGHMSLFARARESCRRYLDLSEDALKEIESAAWKRAHAD